MYLHFKNLLEATGICVSLHDSEVMGDKLLCLVMRRHDHLKKEKSSKHHCVTHTLCHTHLDYELGLLHALINQLGVAEKHRIMIYKLTQSVHVMPTGQMHTHANTHTHTHIHTRHRHTYEAGAFLVTAAPTEGNSNRQLFSE